MFESFADFDRVLVTGPQRSGTTICGAMIAQDTGFEFVDERQIRVHDFHILRLLCRVAKQCVIQCPALSARVHEVADERTLVVLVRRPLEEIYRSQERIGWDKETEELFRLGVTSGRAAEVKYRFWESCQRDRIAHWREIDYASLSAHPLWVPALERRSFNAKQIRRGPAVADDATMMNPAAEVR